MIKNIFIVLKTKDIEYEDDDGNIVNGTLVGACRAFDSFHKAQRYIEENHKTLEPEQQFIIDGIPFDVEKSQ